MQKIYMIKKLRTAGKLSYKKYKSTLTLLFRNNYNNVFGDSFPHIYIKL
jgi:hypothetical protein